MKKREWDITHMALTNLCDTGDPEQIMVCIMKYLEMVACGIDSVHPVMLTAMRAMQYYHEVEPLPRKVHKRLKKLIAAWAHFTDVLDDFGQSLLDTNIEERLSKRAIDEVLRKNSETISAYEAATEQASKMKPEDMN